MKKKREKEIKNLFLGNPLECPTVGKRDSQTGLSTKDRRAGRGHLHGTRD
jgi:hypothetical protein